MPSRGWSRDRVEDGVATYHLEDFREFHGFVYQEMMDYSHYIWRGQRCDGWVLEPTLDRTSGMDRRGRDAHLKAFQYATRGRRGPHPRRIHDDDDWWALGQHYGLATPLLDWTTSPFAAAYFAFFGVGSPQTPLRAIYALGNTRKARDGSEIRRIRPFVDDNARLVSQSGLFTRAPDGVDVETWVQREYQGETSEEVLIKVTVPDAERHRCLRSLDAMNINHLTLFPDLYGASRYCNVRLELVEREG